LTEAPVWLRDLYKQHGEQFALWITDKPMLKDCIRILMDNAIERRLGSEQTLTSEPVTPVPVT
jgi:hypothetical protein